MNFMEMDILKMKIKTKIWKHKETGKEYRVKPWWECIPCNIPVTDIVRDENDEWPDRMFAFGTLIQIGWLLENEHDVWFGTNNTVKEYFDEIGEIEEEEEKEENNNEDSKV
jgi:hypothetical protein